VGYEGDTGSAEGAHRPPRKGGEDNSDTEKARPEETFYKSLIESQQGLLLDAEGHVDPAREAYWCYCWAAVLTGLSNSHHFGLETDSPDALRHLAIAFLNRAKDLGEKLGGAAISAAAIDDGIGALFGKKYDCTAVLFANMKRSLLDQAKKHPALQNIYQTLIPPRW
jgi:hypothetical protein